MPLVYLGRREVEELLPMGECIEVMAAIFGALARGETLQPLRSVVRLESCPGFLGLMPGQIGVQSVACDQIAGIKVLSIFPGNRAVGRESHQGAVLLFETASGCPLAYLDASAVTAIRTAAVSGLATRLLAGEEAGDLAILGAGTQARTHLEALAAVRPLRRVRVWSRKPESARAFAAAESARHGLPVEPAASVRQAVEGADLICTTTAAAEPILAGEWIAAGAHVNAVGACFAAARELDTAAVVRARLFVDSRESAVNESGDFLIPRREGAIGDTHIQGELGELVLGRVVGRRSPDEVTLFKSLGLAVEDLAASHHVYRKALARGSGIVLEPAERGA
ncbi:MAG TPA: ornithine cyclodeaminase family protein [Thermoanaerobaculia bacterium]|nr:ornithine cyclodeaminase family protein [Thermoanaerobaculia bacterium]